MSSGVFKCKNCGASIDLSKAINGVIECEYCNSIFTVPKKEVSPAALSYLRQGEHDLDTGKFDDAYSAFYKAWENDKSEPEAFWGLALAEFEVQFIKDLVNNRLQPICHTISEKNFCDNENYNYALQLATPKQRTEYEKKAAEIDYIKNEFYKLKNSGLDYDCFICVKVTGDNGEKTEDYKDADYIYNLLRNKGYKPFFSERDIRNKTGVDYEAMILYALHTAETMLVVCRDERYLQTPWVKNEYTRFLKLVNDEEKESDSITIVYYGNPIERLPNKNGKIQGIDFSSRESDGKIVEFVEKHTPFARTKREEEQRKKSEEADLIRQQIEEQKKAQKALEERLKNLNPNTATGAASTVETLLTRANQEMEAKNFEKAKNFFETVLERAPENGAAWWGLFLCDNKCSLYEVLLDKINCISNNKDYSLLFEIRKNYNFIYAKNYADKQLLEQLDKIECACKNRILELLKPSYINLEADNFYRTVLQENPDCCEAQYGLMLISYGCVSEKELDVKLSTNYNFLESFSTDTLVQKLCCCKNEAIKKRVSLLHNIYSIKLSIADKSIQKAQLEKERNRYNGSGKKLIHSLIVCTLLAVCAYIVYLLIMSYISDGIWEWSSKTRALLIIAILSFIFALCFASLFNDTIILEDAWDSSWTWFGCLIIPPLFALVSVYVILKNIVLLPVRVVKLFVNGPRTSRLNSKIKKIDNEISDLWKKIC